ncbi:hypothetical protein [Frigoribacterium sp. RIT-PI-h]|uniref:DUF7882 family protein n=1 Tax=Frigoribacterium sp. RIT-PI-h TaxID=1690245 RepID=UPI0006B8CB5A|nr:hypothetical protein [Frigoribacterium sp. RIT-PI-h]
MGTLRYGAEAISMDDRTLGHVQRAMAGKLRNGEGFLLTWRLSPDEGSGRVSLWCAPGIPLAFRYDEPVGAIDSSVVRSLVTASYEGRGHLDAAALAPVSPVATT